MAMVVGERSVNVSRFQDLERRRRPMMLKDFLRDGGYSNNSNGFRVNPKSRALISSTKPSIVLLRSRSKRAAATTISAIQKVINVVKFFQFESVKRRAKLDGGDAVKVQVKDILRWRSFRDLEEEKKGSTPLDLPCSSPDRTATTASSFSKRSRWCDSDFSDEELLDNHPCRVDRNEEILGKKSCLGHGQPANGEEWGNLKQEDWSIDEESEQQSPVSVLHSPFRPIKISSVERAKCELTRRFNQETTYQDQQHCTASSTKNVAEEHKARELLSHVLEDDKSNRHLDCDLVLDFFMEEIISRKKGKDDDFGEVLGAARSWMNGEYSETYEWEIEGNRKAYVEDMGKGVCWGSKFRRDEEDDEVSRELEDEVMDELLDDLLADFLAHS